MDSPLLDTDKPNRSDGIPDVTSRRRDRAELLLWRNLRRQRLLGSRDRQLLLGRWSNGLHGGKLLLRSRCNRQRLLRGHVGQQLLLRRKADGQLLLWGSRDGQYLLRRLPDGKHLLRRLIDRKVLLRRLVDGQHLLRRLHQDR